MTGVNILAGSLGHDGHHSNVGDHFKSKIGKSMTGKIINRLPLVRILQEIRDRYDPEPDAPEDCVPMTTAECKAAAENVFRMYPDLGKK
jgi:hypothetical protein